METYHILGPRYTSPPRHQNPKEKMACQTLHTVDSFFLFDQMLVMVFALLLHLLKICEICRSAATIAIPADMLESWLRTHCSANINRTSAQRLQRFIQETAQSPNSAYGYSVSL